MDVSRDLTLSTAGRLISAYGEQEPWKEDHDRAMYCCWIEDNLEWGIVLFNGLSSAAVRLQKNATLMKTPEAESRRRNTEEIYRSWAGTAGKFLKAADELAAEGFSVGRREDFRQFVAEAEAMTGNADLEPGIPPIEELERTARPECPRPGRYLS